MVMRVEDFDEDESFESQENEDYEDSDESYLGEEQESPEDE
jgi:hypothetical protein